MHYYCIWRLANEVMYKHLYCMHVPWSVGKDKCARWLCRVFMSGDDTMVFWGDGGRRSRPSDCVCACVCMCAYTCMNVETYYRQQVSLAHRQSNGRYVQLLWRLQSTLSVPISFYSTWCTRLPHCLELSFQPLYTGLREREAGGGRGGGEEE